MTEGGPFILLLLLAMVFPYTGGLLVILSALLVIFSPLYDSYPSPRNADEGAEGAEAAESDAGDAANEAEVNYEAVKWEPKDPSLRFNSDFYQSASAEVNSRNAKSAKGAKGVFELRLNSVDSEELK